MLLDAMGLKLAPVIVTVDPNGPEYGENLFIKGKVV
jgi:hypothetical protein